ncbi:hypothetical protein [Arthrobacter sp. MP_2.3]|uniref:hypothetical protein n=1 Tax=Arthrobacter sp. MP_2.3 TaxID=3349633 RepID=UPI0038D4E497
MSTEKPVSSVLNSAATIGGAISLGAYFIPFTKEFMIAHPLWGWGLFICTLIVTSVASEQVARRRESLATEKMQKKFDDLDLQSRQKDIELLGSRVGDLGQDSEFYIYLADDPSYEHLALWFSSKLEETVRTWERDTRDIRDTSLSEVWKCCLKAARTYSKTIAKHMQTKERRASSLEVSPVLGRDSPAAYNQALSELQNAGKEFELWLQEVHRVTHAG